MLLRQRGRLRPHPLLNDGSKTKTLLLRRLRQAARQDKQADRRAGKQAKAGGQAGKKASKQASKQASRQAGKRASEQDRRHVYESKVGTGCKRAGTTCAQKKNATVTRSREINSCLLAKGGNDYAQHTLHFPPPTLSASTGQK